MTTIQVPTQQEIVERFNERQGGDIFGDEVSLYIPYMDFEQAKPFLKEGVTKEGWDKDRTPLSREAVLKQMEEYMDFAWEKANGCRGLSANRTMMYYIAWTWLSGDREFSGQVEREYHKNYRYYGKDILVMICKFYGWDPVKWDNGRRQNREDD